MSVPGYHVTIHSSLTTPILLAGAPRTFSILNGTLCAAVTLGLRSLYALPICAILQIVAVSLTKKDAYFFEAILRHLKQKPFYDV